MEAFLLVTEAKNGFHTMKTTWRPYLHHVLDCVEVTKAPSGPLGHDRRPSHKNPSTMPYQQISNGIEAKGSGWSTRFPPSDAVRKSFPLTWVRYNPLGIVITCPCFIRREMHDVKSDVLIRPTTFPMNLPFKHRRYHPPIDPQMLSTSMEHFGQVAGEW